MSKQYEFPTEFLELVRTMPFVEAEEMLETRRQEVLARLYAADKADKVDLGYILSAINGELSLVRQKLRRVKVGQAVRDCFGDEGFAAWRERVVMMELEALA